MFDPKTDKFPYPKETDRHYLKLKMDRGIVFDAEYPYIDRSPFFLFRQGVVRFLLYLLAFPVSSARMGLRIRGRKNLKKHRQLLKDGAVSVSNHVHMWDYIAVMNAIRPRRSNLLAWAPNINGENGTLIRMVGGIPIPETGFSAVKAYLTTVRGLLSEGRGWLHVYAEGSMWEYYAPIRPFKTGAAYLACSADKPVVPLAFSYREPGWIRKHVFHQIARLTLSIGEPLLPDHSLGLHDRERDLTERAHAAVCALAGFAPGENPYPPVFEHTERVDYYTSTYGIGYKGSH